LQEVTDRLALCRREKLREREVVVMTTAGLRVLGPRERERGADEGYLRVKGLLTNVTLSQ
jgi:hypothetical protein